jgi:two-component system chemotaxis response regulator CheY
MKTLIVEDESTSRLILQTVLSRYGECYVAVNGREAVAAFQMAAQNGSSFDLVCMDIIMPEMDGKQAVKLIRAVEESLGVKPTLGVKIIMTTVLTDMKEIIQSFQHLCDAYLFKPIDTAELISKLRSFRLVA